MPLPVIAGIAIGVVLAETIRYVTTPKEERAAKKKERAANALKLSEQNVALRQKQRDAAEKAEEEAIAYAEAKAAPQPKRSKSKARA